MKKIFLSSFFLVSSFSNHCSDGSSAVSVIPAKCFDQVDLLSATIAGFNKGKKEGFEIGKNAGTKQGAIDGVKLGFMAGHNQGIADGLLSSATLASVSLTATDAIGELKRGKSWKDSFKGVARTCAFGAAPTVIYNLLTKPDSMDEQRQPAAALAAILSLGNVVRIGYKNSKLVQKPKTNNSSEQTDLVFDLNTDESFVDNERYQKLVQSEHDMRQKYKALKDDVVVYGNTLDIPETDKIILLELFPSLREFVHPRTKESQEFKPESTGAEWKPFEKKDDFKSWKNKNGW